ncbi:MAG: aspartyl/asparaginyl beta-hydroxylase domain-containing protein [Gloeotrichia echinulata GP01]
MFEDSIHYPQLTQLQSHWQDMRDEVMEILFAAHEMFDKRADHGWFILPLLVEPEDFGVFPDRTIARARGYVPNLCDRVDRIERLHAYALSILNPSAKIKPHTHRNPFASASICLSGCEGAILNVDNATHTFTDGSMVIFDYRRLHSVTNMGSARRVALVVAVDLAHNSMNDHLPHNLPLL